MLKFIHVTDVHLVAAGEALHGLDPLERFKRCAESIRQCHADAHCIVVTGDLADRGEGAAYQLFRQTIAQTGLPVHCIIGNHDDRAICVANVPEAQTDSNGFVQFTVETPAGVFVMLDTLIPGSHSGGLCDLRQNWLRDQLQLLRGEPVFLFMHHPPFDLHLPCIDRIGFENKQEMSVLVAAHDNIRHLFFGHAHRPLSGNWKGISFSSLRGTNHQVSLDFHSSNITYSREDPEYSVVFVDDDQIVVHTHNYVSG